MSSHRSFPNSMAAEEEVEEGAADWSNLPYDLIEEIMDQVAGYTLDISDYARCAAVCVSWRQVYKYHDPLISTQLPVLMIPTDTPSSSSNKDQSHSFYRITDGKVYDRLKFRMPSYRRCRGSSHGWLVTVDDVVDKGFPVQLINPFLRYKISLPSLKHLPVYDYDSDDHEDDGDDGPSNYSYLHKAILSADPLSNPDHYIVMAIYGRGRFKRLAYWRPGNQAWVPIGPKRVKFEDVILKSNEVSFSYFNDEFRAVTSGGYFFSFKVRDILDENAADAIANTHKRSQYSDSRVKLPHVLNKKFYLVPVLNKTKFFLVLRVIDIGVEDETAIRCPYSTKEFKVYMWYSKKEQDDGNFSYSTKEQDGGNTSFEWKEMKTLLGYTLFIGDNASMSVRAEDCPPGCKRDCIYYTDDCYLGYVNEPAGNGAHDMGLFNVKDSSFEKHYPTDTNNPIWPIPIWVEPSIQKAGGVFRN